MCPWHQHSTIECQCWLLWLSSREILSTSAACRGQYSVLIAFSLSPNTGSKVSVSFIICTVVRNYPFCRFEIFCVTIFTDVKFTFLPALKFSMPFVGSMLTWPGQTISHSFVCLARFKELILYYYCTCEKPRACPPPIFRVDVFNRFLFLVVMVILFHFSLFNRNGIKRPECFFVFYNWFKVKILSHNKMLNLTNSTYSFINTKVKRYF